MTDTELNQLRQNLSKQFRQMMAEDSPVAVQDPTESEWQRSPKR